MTKENVYNALANALTFIDDTVAEANGRPLEDFLEYHNILKIVCEEIDAIKEGE